MPGVCLTALQLAGMAARSTLAGLPGGHSAPTGEPTLNLEPKDCTSSVQLAAAASDGPEHVA